MKPEHSAGGGYVRTEAHRELLRQQCLERKPWLKSTGPKTPEGRYICGNGFYNWRKKQAEEWHMEWKAFALENPDWLYGVEDRLEFTPPKRTRPKPEGME